MAVFLKSFVALLRSILLSFLAIYVCPNILLSILRPRLARHNKIRRKAILRELGVTSDTKVLVGLFHPDCNAGGGGERVLWTAVACLHRNEPDVICLVYTGDVDATKADIIEKVQSRFSITLDPSRLHLVYLKSRYLIEDTTWKHFTLIGQSLGSIVLAHDALMSVLPDVFIDTMGYAFTLPLVKLYAKIPVGADVYFILVIYSTDMLQRVRKRTTSHTNPSLVARSTLLSSGKFIYYLIFARLYSYCLRRADHLMVNSSWTQSHINQLLGLSIGVRTSAYFAKIVYPPCDTGALSSLPFATRENMILSVAQFRPEKEHSTQLRALKAFIQQKKIPHTASVKLVMAGSVRNAGDEKRIAELRTLAKELGVADQVDFVINPPFPELLKLFGRASIGLSTMVDEHFGINIVEFMAAGLIPLVHASGGPLLDIVIEQGDLATGFHATTPEDYGRQLGCILSMSPEEALEMRKRARVHAVAHFSEAAFDKEWKEAWRLLVAQSK
ncbi:MAG: asparagine-linked glycosylation protein [Cyphobasidiales sp. Tagirdzhanova-0007]|nr:MAG: asparagine-linked glycosylation protein [Cyphobasidiales sp. Tagirdzhanova-0007]